uniref:SRCR domain-containing protein n=1 Tax=Cyprinus carpio TaxID=7962 RepID=A0A8C1IZ94_CYPCA
MFFPLIMYHVNVRLVGGNSRCAGRVEVLHRGQWGTVCDDYWDMADAAVVFRLVGGSRCSGRLEILHDQTWMSVCDAVFDQQDAEVVCRELDCGAPVQVLGAAAFDKGDTQMWTQEIQCRGNESQIHLCQTSPSHENNCSQENNVRLVSAMNVRVVGGNSRCAGRVEVLHRGQWGTVCADDWDLVDAAVVCKELDCGEPVDALGDAHFGSGSGPIWMSALCSGNESYISFCPTSSFKHNCTHENAIGLLCSGNGREVVKSGLMCLIVTGMKQNSQNVPSLHGVELNVLTDEMLESSALVKLSNQESYYANSRGKNNYLIVL